MIVQIVAFVICTITVVYLTLYIITLYNNRNPFQGKQGIYKLSKPGQSVLTSTDFSWSNRSCTMRFAINVFSAPRTIAKVDCITTERGTDSTTFGPDCSDYSFKRCKCVGVNCANCAVNGVNNSTAYEYLSQLVSLGDYVQLWASGYTSQNDKPYVPAILKIRTGPDSTHHYMESITLPAIPLQKWTVITIVKEGRRFDVYYGAELQISKLTDYVPVSPDLSLNWTVGNAKWDGLIGLFMGFNRAYYMPDVLNDVSALLNTRGIPHYTENPSETSYITKCVLGECTKLPDVKPRNPFSVYDTSIA